MKKILTLIFFLCFAGTLAGDELTVRSVKVEGLKRTGKATFIKIAGVKAGDMWNGDKKKHILRRLEKMGNFSNIRIDEKVEGKQVDISVHAQDKWTLMGFPMASSSGSSKAYGVGVFESNFLGLQKGVAGLFLLKEKKPQISLFYIDRYFINEKWTFMGAFQMKDEEVAGFQRKSLKFTLSPGYRVNNYITLSLIAGYEDFSHENLDGNVNVLPGNSGHFVAGISAGYDNMDQKEDNFSGVRITGSLISVMGKDIEDFFRGILKTEFYLSLFSNHTLAVMNQFSISFGAPYGYGFRVGAQGSSEALPIKGFEDNEFLYGNVISGTVEYRLPVKSFSAFTIAMVPFFDYALMADRKKDLFSDEFISSAGIALRFYIRKVALPALQIYVAHNNERRKFKFGFLMGMSF